MNQYRCKTCKKEHQKECPIDLKGANGNSSIFAGIRRAINSCGCASHSDFQNQREKVMDELEERRLKYEQDLQQLTLCFDEYDRGLIEGKECFVIILKEWIKELRGERG